MEIPSNVETTTSSDRSWPRWVTVVQWTAILVPVLYGFSRVLWAVGIPVGIEQERMGEMGLPGSESISLILLSAPAVATAWFTWWFLVRRYASLPKWIPLIGGVELSRWLIIGVACIPIVILTYANIVNMVVLTTDLVPAGDMAGLTTWSLWAHVVLFLMWWLALIMVVARYYRRAAR